VRRQAERHAAKLAVPGALRLGIGDDCAILRTSAREELVITTDLFLEQVHFRRGWHQPEVAGHRCLVRGLSDVAAMGATPVAAFLSFALPLDLAGDWAQRFLDGLLRLARLHDVPLAGGDTAQAPGVGSKALFSADIVLIGSVPRGKALLRSGAKPGDAIYVTGALGGAAAELASLSANPAAYTRLTRPRRGHPHLFPTPRLAAGRALLGRATAALDLSDGLSTDLAHLCEESGVAAEIEAALIPVHPLASGSLDLALHGGEDYDLLFTAPAGRRFPAELGGTAIHRIGTILSPGRGRPRITLIDKDGKRSPLRNLGWEHFTRRPR
jgi:thiamine-monophosphate kinase